MTGAGDAWGLAFLGGWTAWAIAWALGLRLVLAAGARRYLKLGADRAAVIAYLGIVIIFVGSFFLHGAVLGPGNMYGATPREAFSLEAYFVAPFGLPLFVGGVLVIFGEVILDVLRFIGVGRR